MNFFTKKNFLFKLIISICIILAITNCTGGQKVYAAEGAKVGGTLLSPICDLVLGIGDALMNILQNAIMGTDATLELDNTKKIDWGAVILWLVVIAVVVAATIITAGGVWAALGPMLVGAAKIAAIYGAICLVTGGGAHVVVTSVLAESLTDVVVLPTYNIGPEEIFSGRILLFDANVFNPKEVWVDYNIVDEADGKTVTGSNTVTLQQWNETYKYSSNNQPERFYYEKDGEHEIPNNKSDDIETSINNSAYELRNVITKWYYIIRTIALVGSMLILLYIGIRIIISSIAEEKAKYKQMLGDWVIALCLIFLLHYIMIFSHNIVESVTDIFTGVVENGTHTVSIAGLTDDNNVLIESIQDLEREEGQYYDKDNKLIKWPANLMGRIRIEAQKQDGTVGYIGYVVAYLVLVIYTLTFAFTYIKRLLYLLFLTVIAPFVALTYPIDKIHDGKAQAFDMWLKEYIFNLLIQPFHLLLYTIFVSMAFELSSTNIIYTLVVLGFMMPAEKFLRTMFGFNKASTPGMLGGAAGAALAMSAVNSLGKFSKGGRGGIGGKDGGKDNGGKEDKDKIRTADSKHNQNDLFESLGAGNNNGGANQNPTQVNQQLGNNNGGANQNPTQVNQQLGNNNGSNLDQERNRLKSERNVLEEFEAEGALSDNWSDEDYEAYQELEREQLEAEEKLRQQEKAENAQIPVPVDDTVENNNPPAEVNQPDNSRSQATVPPQANPAQLATSNSSNGKNKNGKSFWRGVGKTTLRAAKSVGRYVPTAGGFVGKASLGLAGGMLGLAAGIASGDPSKAFQNTTAGAGVGVAVASGVTNRITKGAEKSVGTYRTTKENWERDYYGADYEKEKRKKLDEEFVKDKEVRELYKQKLGLKDKKEVNEVMKNALEYRAYGINDNSTIIKAMQLDNGNPLNKPDNRRIAAAKLAEASKTRKDFDTNMKRFAETKGISQAQVDDMKRLVRKINDQ